MFLEEMCVLITVGDMKVVCVNMEVIQSQSTKINYYYGFGENNINIWPLSDLCCTVEKLNLAGIILVYDYKTCNPLFLAL